MSVAEITAYQVILAVIYRSEIFRLGQESRCVCNDRIMRRCDWLFMQTLVFVSCFCEKDYADFWFSVDALNWG